MACWDITAKAASRPLCEALGARFGEAVPLYNVVTVLPLDEAVALARELVAEGYRRLQVKVGPAPEADAERLAAVRDAVGPDIVLFADANGAFTAGGARRFLRATRDLEYTFEQPCRTYAECASVRPASDRPLVLDESIVTLDDLLRAHRDRVADGITVKLQRVGGITRAMLIRDVAVELGVEVTVEDAGGASLVTAAIVHVGLGTPERQRVHTCDFHTWVSVDHGTGLPPRADGGQRPPAGAGLGIDVDLATPRRSRRRRLGIEGGRSDGGSERTTRQAGPQRRCSGAATAGEAVAALSLAREPVPADRDPQRRPGGTAPRLGAHRARAGRHPGAAARGSRGLPHRRRRGRRGDDARAVRAGARRAIRRPGARLVRARSAVRPSGPSRSAVAISPRSRSAARPPSAISTAASARATSRTSATSSG